MKSFFGLTFLVLVLSGCSKSSPSNSTTNSKLAARPASTVDTSKLPLRVEAAGYTMQLPSGFDSIPLNSSNPNRKLAAWRKVNNGTNHAVSIHVIVDPKLISETISNPDKALLNFSAGVADSGKFTIDERSPMDIVTSQGLTWHRTQWRGQMQGGPAVGWAYIAIDNDRCLMAFCSSIGPDAEDDHKLLEASFGTMKRQ